MNFSASENARGTTGEAKCEMLYIAIVLQINNKKACFDLAEREEAEQRIPSWSSWLKSQN